MPFTSKPATIPKSTEEATFSVENPILPPSSKKREGLSATAIATGAVVGTVTANPVAGLAAAAGTDYAIKESKKESQDQSQNKGKGIRFKTLAKIAAVAAVGAVLFTVAPPLFAVGLAATAAVGAVKLGSMALEGLSTGMSKIFSGIMGIFSGKKNRDQEGPQQARSQEQTVEKSPSQQLSVETPAQVKAKVMDPPQTQDVTSLVSNQPSVNPLLKASRARIESMDPEVRKKAEKMQESLTYYGRSAVHNAKSATRGRTKKSQPQPQR